LALLILLSEINTETAEVRLLALHKRSNEFMNLEAQALVHTLQDKDRSWAQRVYKPDYRDLELLLAGSEAEAMLSKRETDI
jgi:hypothetical protein